MATLRFGGQSSFDRTTIFGRKHRLVIRETDDGFQSELTESTTTTGGINPMLSFFLFVDTLLLAITAIGYWAESHPEAVESIMEPLSEGLSGVEIPLELFTIFDILITIAVASVIGQMVLTYGPQWRRLREWHGLEHKLISAAENGNIDTAAACSPLHARCGGCYMVTIYTTYGLLIMAWSHFGLPPVFLLTSVFFVMKLESSYFHDINLPGIWVGMMIQRYLTISEPDAEQLRIGIESMREFINRERCLEDPVPFHVAIGQYIKEKMGVDTTNARKMVVVDSILRP